jgi:hypothetical protein
VPTASAPGLRRWQMQACNIVQLVAVILFNVAALKIAGGLFTLGALVWAIHAAGR